MERCDRLAGTGWLLYYDDHLFPPGTDSFLLSAYPKLKPGLRVCDLGAGTGLLGLLLLRRQRLLDVTGVELSAAALALAEKNAAENGLAERLRFLHADLRRMSELPQAGRFDLVICNPPYFSVGSGAAAPDAERHSARAEVTCTLADVCRAGAFLLRWGGRFCLVYRPDRLTDLLVTMRSAGLEPKRLRAVQKTAGSAPSLLLVEGRRGGRPGLSPEPPMILTNPDGSYTPEINAVYFHTKEDLP